MRIKSNNNNSCDIHLRSSRLKREVNICQQNASTWLSAIFVLPVRACIPGFLITLQLLVGLFTKIENYVSYCEIYIFVLQSDAFFNCQIKAVRGF